MMKKRIGWVCTAVSLLVSLASSGCVGGDARVEMATANLLDVANDSLAQTLNEYHHDIEAADMRREQSIIIAFTRRIAGAARDTDAIEQHTRDFQTALAKLRADTQTEWNRHATAIENVNTLREMATTLRKLAVESLSLEDETKRYLTDALVQLKDNRVRNAAKRKTASASKERRLKRTLLGLVPSFAGRKEGK